MSLSTSSSIFLAVGRAHNLGIDERLWVKGELSPCTGSEGTSSILELSMAGSEPSLQSMQSCKLWTLTQGWTGVENLPGVPQEMVQQWSILPGPTPGKLIKSISSKSERPGAPGAAFGHAGNRGGIPPWVLLGLSSPALTGSCQGAGGTGPGHKK